jgi:hypothetical protein
MDESAGKTDAALQPYLEAAANKASAATVRAVLLKLWTDADVWSGYDQVKAVCSDALLTTTGSTGGASSEGDRLLNTLDLFSYGTYQDYRSADADNKYWQLTEQQCHKLRLLTIISLIQTACEQRKDVLPYSAVQQALDLEQGERQSLRETESLLSQCVAARVISGKLSQKDQAFLITSGPYSPRDVPPSRVEDMLASVRALQTKLRESADNIAERQSSVKNQLEQFRRHMKKTAAAAAAASSDLAGRGDPMEVEPRRSSSSGGGGGRRQKRSRGGFAAFAQRPFGF